MQGKVISSDDPRPSFELRHLVDNILLPEENLVHLASISPGIYWKAVLSVIAALVALVYSLNLAMYFGCLAALLFWMSYNTKKYLLLAATDHRVVLGAGIINQRVTEMRYNKIENVEVFSTLPGRMFGYNSIIISGTGNMRYIIPFVQDAVVFQDLLIQKMLEAEEPLPTTEPVAATA